MKKFNKNSIIATLAVFFVLGLSGSMVARAAGPAPVNLLSAGNFSILAETAITTTGATLIVGDIGIEKIFPVNSPNVEKVVVKEHSKKKIRRAKLYYMRLPKPA